MRSLVILLLLTASLVLSTGVQAQPCSGFSTNPADFADLTEVDLLPMQGFGGPLPIVRGDVEYTGATLVIGTTCPGVFGVLSMCDFSSPVTGVPSAGTTLLRWAVDYWADFGINKFKLEIELQSGAIDNFEATSNSGFVGYCAPAGDPIVRVTMEGHDGTATALYHSMDLPLPSEETTWGKIKALYTR